MSTLQQKVGASIVNCTLVLSLTIPLYPVVGPDIWKMITIGAFWAYNLIFRTRCLGMMLMGTYIHPPSSTLYTSLYTVGFSTFFYHVVFPFDLLLLNGVAQIWSITMTGNTLHANLAHQATTTKDEFLRQCKLEATELLVDGKPLAAVELMVKRTNQWRQLRQPQWIVDLGWKLAREDNPVNVKVWIDGFQ